MARTLVVIVAFVALLGALIGYQSEAADPKLVPQIGWPGSCETQSWSADEKRMVGFFSNPVPAIVEWDAKSWEVLSYRPINGINSPYLISSAALCGNSRYLIINFAQEIGGARMLDTRTGSTVKTFPATVGFSQSGNVIIELQGKTVRLCDITYDKVIGAISAPGNVSFAELSPNGKLLLTIDRDGKGSLWNVATGKLLHTLKHNAPLLGPCVFSPDSKYLITDGDDPKWEPPTEAVTEAAYARTFDWLIWDTASGKQLLRRPDHYSLDGGTSAFIFVENGRKMLSCGMFSVDVWTIPGGKHIRKFDGSGEFLQESPGNQHRGPQRPFSVSPDGKVLAAGPERWSLPSFKLLASIPMYAPASNWLAFSPDGSQLASISSGDSVTVWNIPQLRVSRWLRPSWYESSDTRVLFPANDEVGIYTYGNNVELYSPLTGKLLRKVKPPTAEHATSWIRLSPDGKLLVGDEEYKGRRRLHVWDAKTLVSVATVDEAVNVVRESAFSPDGKWFIAEENGGKNLLYDLENATARRMPGLAGQFVFSPDSHLLAGYQRGSKGPRDFCPTLLDTATGKVMLTPEETGPGDNFPIAFSPNGKVLAAVSGSRIRLFSVETGKAFKDLEETGAVRQIDFDPKGRWIAGTGGLGITLWDADTGKVVVTLLAVPPDRDTRKGGFWVAYRPDGSYNASANGETLLRWFDGASLHPAKWHKSQPTSH